MTKEQARLETIRRWNELPAAERKTFKQALEFAKKLDAEIDFETLGTKGRLIEAWLVREYEERAKAIEEFSAKAKAGP